MFEHCPGLVGTTWGALATVTTASSALAILYGIFFSRISPAGFGTLCIGIAWMALGVLFAVQFYVGMDLATWLAITEKKMVAREIAALLDQGFFEYANELQETRGHEVQGRCLESYRDRTSVLFIPIVLAVCGGMGIAYIVAWLTAVQGGTHQVNQRYIGATNDGVTYELEYKGKRWWSGRDRWEYRRENTSHRTRNEELPPDIVHITTLAQIRLQERFRARVASFDEYEWLGFSLREQGVAKVSRRVARGDAVRGPRFRRR